MSHVRRWKLSAAQRADLWNRWKAGQSLHAIGRALGKDHVVIQLLLARHGGIAPAARRRSRRVLTLAEREDISRGIASGCSMRVIAQRLSRASSTVSREVARHGGRAQYRANQADQQAWESALRPKACLLATHSKLQEIVASKLMQDWSPEQISGWLKQHYPDDESLRVSHETIYRSLFIQARGAQQPRGHAGRPSFAVLHAGESARQGHGYRGGRPEPARATTPGDVAALADLGSRTRDGPTQELHHGYRCTGLLLRSAEPLAARLERKHQWAPAPVPAEEGGSVLLLAVGPGRNRSASESTATKNVGISNSGG